MPILRQFRTCTHDHISSTLKQERHVRSTHLLAPVLRNCKSFVCHDATGNLQYRLAAETARLAHVLHPRPISIHALAKPPLLPHPAHILAPS